MKRDGTYHVRKEGNGSRSPMEDVGEESLRVGGWTMYVMADLREKRISYH